jgi:hypothetical protein
MDLTVKSETGAAPVWNHFLLTGLEVRVRITDSTNHISEQSVPKSGSEFRWTVPDTTVAFDLVIQAALRFEGRDYKLLRIVQTFATEVSGGHVTRLMPLRWQKMTPDQTTGLAKGSPPLHPLLRVSPNLPVVVTLALAFVDITSLFLDVHGDTPWYRTLELLRGTARTLRVLASLRGQPLIWYVVIPQAAAAIPELKPMLLYYAADYGGIDYADSLAGIKSPNHNTSVGDVQCGGETLVSFLTKPISDDEYDAKLDAFVAMRERFEKRQGRNPPPLQHFRSILSYHTVNATLVPDYWNVPFGFEAVIAEHKKILLIPQINGGNGGIAIKEGLKDLIASALSLIYAQGNALSYETMTVANPILVCYSQSGGNAFTAANRNVANLQGLVCFEPQYMNKHLDGEDKSLLLGKKVIPVLLAQSIKVAIIGRHKDGWEQTYLPERVNAGEMIVLPDDAHYFLLKYPEPSKPYDPNASPVLARRYSRLLKNKADRVIKGLISGALGDVDTKSAVVEERVEKVIDKYRADGLDDQRLIKAVFVSSYNVDGRGGWFTHNFIISSGQEMMADGTTIRTFFNQVLAGIG